MKKSPQAFRTISEVAKVLDVPAHVLRFWETRFSQIKPVKRGGGRRYYRPEDVDLIRGIRNLLYTEGLTIKGAQKILRDKGQRHVVAIGRGEDAQIAEADALWDEPGVGDMATAQTPATPTPTAEPASEPRATRQTSQRAMDPRQSSLFGDDDLGESVIEQASPDTVNNAFTEEPTEPETDPDHSESHPHQMHSTPVGADDADEQTSDPADTALDQDALRRVFGKLKALRASMDDD